MKDPCRRTQFAFGVLSIALNLLLWSCASSPPQPSVPQWTAPTEWSVPDSIATTEPSSRAPQSLGVSASVVALAYYGFGDPAESAQFTSVDLFWQQIRYLQERRFHFVSISEARQALKEPKSELQVAITIEGWSAPLEQILKELQSKSVPITWFLNSSDLKLPEATKLIEEHKKNPLLSIGLRGSGVGGQVLPEKQSLTRIWGRPPVAYSYPAGENPNAVLPALRSSGIPIGLSHYSGAIGKDDDPLLWPRFPLNQKFGALAGPTGNGFEIRAHALPLELKAIDSERRLQSNQHFVGITTKIHDARPLNCFLNGSPVARIIRTAKAEKFATSMKNWGHKYEINLQSPPSTPPLLRCTLLAQPGSASTPPRFYWGTVPLGQGP